MAKRTTAITDTSATEIAMVVKPHNATTYNATICVSGTFGGGTVTLQLSPDNGTTKIPLKDQSGSVWSATANDVIEIEIGNSSHNSDNPILYATNAGGVGVNMTVTVFDNVG